MSNDVLEVQHTLGLEAACRVLVTELRNVLSFDGSFVNDRHIQLLVDTMAYRGSLQPVTRHGVNKYEVSTLKKCTFEETLDTLVDAGIYEMHDQMTGVTENLVFGQTTSIGSHVCSMGVDIRQLASVEPTPPFQPVLLSL